MKSALLLIGLLIFAAILYLIWEVWHIFGFWRIVGLSVLLIIVQVLAAKSSLKRFEKDGRIIYAPKELPIYIGVLCGFGVVGYLYTHLNTVTTITDLEYKFGIAYLVLNSIQIVSQFFTVFRNRHDKAEINSEGVLWTDIEEGKDVGQNLSWSDIDTIEKDLTKIIINMKTGKKHELVPSQMNMALFLNTLYQDLLEIGKKHGVSSKKEKAVANLMKNVGSESTEELEESNENIESTTASTEEVTDSNEVVESTEDIVDSNEETNAKTEEDESNTDPEG